MNINDKLYGEECPKWHAVYMHCHKIMLVELRPHAMLYGFLCQAESIWYWYSQLLSKNVHVRLIGESKLSLGVSVSVHGCYNLCLCESMTYESAVKMFTSQFNIKTIHVCVCVCV